MRGTKPPTKSPKFVEPMLLLRGDALPEGPNWAYELKLDGYRALAFKADGQINLRDFGNLIWPTSEVCFGPPSSTERVL